ncbi:phosphate ABC transporter, PhoT family TC 3.A.1.7.1, membrane protein 1 [Oleiphilus messinensis]|uniref:Phosphate transport system permease protein n=1 Tax=Oleiphilus messinensis TaxID=141451 RepID=A0A1Y0I4Z5_9GAMM|nr:phosphate ABC transporter permease subunit PstC [Oleiphilus messinensis]ARU54605.1 phosphate ABC transporter, PhoT family TC 3.A.1.7.1, membrane protein 1 [Oleiphilus messinensis]
MRTSIRFDLALKSAAWLSIVVLTLIILFVLYRSMPFLLSDGVQGLWSDTWAPTQGAYNMLPMIAGSLAVTLLAVVISGPLGIVIALFGRFYAPRAVRSIYIALIELMAGIPSVVYGLWGLVVLVPVINLWVPPGASVLAAGIVLALMILPLITLVADDAFQRIPGQWQQAARALALTRWGCIRKLYLPAARPGILAGITLQTGRALGETMAVLMVCGNIVQIPGSLFEPARTLTANIALEMAYATDRHAQALFVSGLLLLLTAVLLVWLAGRIQAVNQEGLA